MVDVHGGLVAHTLDNKGGGVNGVHDGDIGSVVDAVVMRKILDGEGDVN